MAISLAIREKIIEFYKDGLSKHQIATRLKESRTSVRRIIKKYEETGKLESQSTPCKSLAGLHATFRISLSLFFFPFALSFPFQSSLNNLHAFHSDQGFSFDSKPAENVIKNKK